MKILTFSKSAWDDSNSTGNTFSNLFRGYDKANIAHLYLRNTLPNNDVCIKYFSINEEMILKSIYNRRITPGHYFIFGLNETTKANHTDESYYSYFRNKNNRIAKILQNLFWNVFQSWKNEKIEKFLSDFQPDVIFLENLETPFLNKILWYIQEKSNAKIVIFHTDDYLTLGSTKKFLDKKYGQYMAKIETESTLRADLNYSISPQLADLYEEKTGKKMRILHKGANFNVKPPYQLPNANEPVIITYIGSIFYGRWRTLGLLAQQIKKMNQTNQKYILNIYSQFNPSEEMNKKMIIEGASAFKGQLKPSEIEEIYRQSDIVLHVESLDLEEREHTKMSFSTKIIDLLSSGRPIMAIGWEEAASIDYFIKNDAAFIANNEEQILDILKKIDLNRNILSEYADKAWNSGSINHHIEDIQSQLYEELQAISKDS